MKSSAGSIIRETSIPPPSGGIDAALVRISGPATQPRVRLVAFETLAYSAPVRQTILRIATGEPATAGKISQLNFLLGELFADAVVAASLVLLGSACSLWCRCSARASEPWSACGQFPVNGGGPKPNACVRRRRD